MATDVFPVVTQDNPIDLTRPSISGWLAVFYGAMAVALVLASLRLVWPPDESRTDSTITAEIQ